MIKFIKQIIIFFNSKLIARKIRKQDPFIYK